MEVDLGGTGGTRIVQTQTHTDEDLAAVNSLAEPERVAPAANAYARIVDGILTLDMPAVSWTAVALAG